VGGGVEIGPDNQWANRLTPGRSVLSAQAGILFAVNYCHHLSILSGGGTQVDSQEIVQFLAERRIAVMATINRDGTPQLTPNWYHYDGNKLNFVTTKERLKYFNLHRDSRMSVCIYATPLASDYVVIKGTVTIKYQDFWKEARQVIERYVEADQVDDYVERWKQQPRILVSVTPERISTRNR